MLGGLNDMALEQLSAADSLINYAMKSSALKESIATKSALGKNHLLRMKIFSDMDNYAGAHIESKVAIRVVQRKPYLDGKTP